jgi:hypothetical protein
VALGLPSEGRVVAVAPVPDWVDPPDVTLPLVWAVEHRSGAAAPVFYWMGVPDDDDRRWMLDYDIARMGLTRLRTTPDVLPWSLLLLVADLVLLPTRSPVVFPEGFAAVAALRPVPVVCWEGHPQADEVARWGGTVVPWGDVPAMADLVADATRSASGWARAAAPSWRLTLAEIERIVPVEVPPR